MDALLTVALIVLAIVFGAKLLFAIARAIIWATGLALGLGLRGLVAVVRAGLATRDRRHGG